MLRSLSGLEQGEFEQKPQLEGPDQLKDAPVFGYKPWLASDWWHGSSTGTTTVTRKTFAAGTVGGCVRTTCNKRYIGLAVTCTRKTRRRNIHTLIDKERSPEAEIEAAHAVLEDVARQRLESLTMVARDLKMLDELEVQPDGLVDRGDMEIRGVIGCRTVAPTLTAATISLQL